MAQGSSPSVRPAKGASALPTTGMNKMGVMAFQPGPPDSLACNQRAVTQRVARISSSEPTAHTQRIAVFKLSEAFQKIATPKLANSMMEIGIVAKNGCRTGCCISMATAEGYWDQRTRLNTLINRKMTKATAPASVANKVGSPSPESEARNQACANPHHPMTGTNQTGERCSKAFAPGEDACIHRV